MVLLVNNAIARTDELGNTTGYTYDNRDAIALLLSAIATKGCDRT
ncbi:MAG: hypothetical protein QNJ36_09330 [Calothrix sp. MO_167.B42]|nr:hypothetical protein [Calothrix sp. MO_167.B42]